MPDSQKLWMLTSIKPVECLGSIARYPEWLIAELINHERVETDWHSSYSRIYNLNVKVEVELAFGPALRISRMPASA